MAKYVKTYEEYIGANTNLIDSYEKFLECTPVDNESMRKMKKRKRIEEFGFDPEEVKLPDAFIDKSNPFSGIFPAPEVTVLKGD